jgi:formylglycine-generating enzyme
MNRMWPWYLAGLVVAGLTGGMSAPALAQHAVPERVGVGSFAIDRTEVSIGAYRAYVDAKGAKTAAERDGGGFEFVGGWTRRAGWTWAAPFGAQGAADEPAVHLTWSEASDYCRHVGGRLPTWPEWRLAAYTETRDVPTDGFVKGETYRYPVGATPSGMNTNRQRHLPVGTTKIGVNGLYDMGANVWEWVSDRRGGEALTAGSSWWYGPENTTADGAQWKAADFYAVYIGFRCAYDRGR